MARTVMIQGRYLGGHPARSRKTDGMLVVDSGGVKVKVFKAFIDEPWTNIHALSVDGPDQVANRITATRLLLTGPLALAWKKEKKIGFVVVQGTFGEFLFEVKKKTPQELRAQIAPWATSVKAVAPAEPQPPAPPEPVAAASEPTPEPTLEPASPLAAERDKIDLLRELGELRAGGVLTEDEFEQQKARILGG